MNQPSSTTIAEEGQKVKHINLTVSQNLLPIQSAASPNNFRQYIQDKLKKKQKKLLIYKSEQIKNKKKLHLESSLTCNALEINSCSCSTHVIGQAYSPGKTEKACGSMQFPTPTNNRQQGTIQAGNSPGQSKNLQKINMDSQTLIQMYLDDQSISDKHSEIKKSLLKVQQQNASCQTERPLVKLDLDLVRQAKSSYQQQRDYIEKMPCFITRITPKIGHNFQQSYIQKEDISDLSGKKLAEQIQERQIQSQASLRRKKKTFPRSFSLMDKQMCKFMQFQDSTPNLHKGKNQYSAQTLISPQSATNKYKEIFFFSPISQKPKEGGNVRNKLQFVKKVKKYYCPVINSNTTNSGKPSSSEFLFDKQYNSGINLNSARLIDNIIAQKKAQQNQETHLTMKIQSLTNCSNNVLDMQTVSPRFQKFNKISDNQEKRVIYTVHKSPRVEKNIAKDTQTNFMVNNDEDIKEWSNQISEDDNYITQCDLIMGSQHYQKSQHGQQKDQMINKMKIKKFY